MARIKFGAIVTDGSGSLGGHTLQHSEGGNQIRTKPLPNSSPTSPQYNIRRKIPCLQYSWKALSAIQKTVWNRYAVDHDIRSRKGDHEILSGHSLWMKYQYYNWTEECNLPVDPAVASLLYPVFADYIPPDFRPVIPPVFPPHVTPSAKPTIALSGNLSLCEGQSVSLISSFGDFYLWSTGATTHTITVNTPGSYTVKVGNVGNLWSVDSDPAVVTVGTPPAAPIITVTDYLPGPVDDPNYILLIGEGSFATLTSEEAESYIWSTGEITRSIQVSATGFYTVRVANAQGCLSPVSRRITVQSYVSPPQPVITPSGPLEFCEGGSVDLECSESYKYVWSTGETSRTITVSDSGSYTVTIKTNQGYISLPSDPAVVTVNELPAQPTITPSGPLEFCEGGSVDLESSVGTSYLWSTTETTRTITVTDSGSYTVQVENADGCQSIPSDAADVIVNDSPAQPTITPSGPTEFCQGGSVDLQSSVSTSYLWYKDTISTGLTTRTITASVAGSYTVKVTNAGGCQSIASAATVITVNEPPAKPTITPSGPLDISSGGSVDLESSVGTSYLWSNSETTRTITVSASGSYTVQVGEAHGCLSPASDPAVVTVYDRGFKTRWVVAGDFAARTITLPLKANRTEGALAYDFIVSWGDGSTGHVTAWNSTLKTHTYINNGTYDVEIWGTCEGWSFDNGTNRLNITKVLDWGVSTGFNGFKYLKSGFYGCYNLNELAAGGPLASGTGCLTDGFQWFLLNCIGLTSLDSDLFKLHPNVSTHAFEGALAGMEELITLPVDLFRYNIYASSYAFTSLCGDCYKLETVPTDIFRYNVLASYAAFEMTFCNCEALQSLPTDIFRYNVLVSGRGFCQTCAGCLVLATVGVNLFRYNVLVIVDGFRYTFYNCEKLQLRSDMFYAAGESSTRFHDQSPCFDNTFQRQQYTGVQGTAPDLWNCDFGTGTPYTFWCYQGEGNSIDSLTNYINIPDEWKFEPE